MVPRGWGVGAQKPERRGEEPPVYSLVSGEPLPPVGLFWGGGGVSIAPTHTPSLSWELWGEGGCRFPRRPPGQGAGGAGWLVPAADQEAESEGELGEGAETGLGGAQPVRAPHPSCPSPPPCSALPGCRRSLLRSPLWRSLPPAVPTTPPLRTTRCGGGGEAGGAGWSSPCPSPAGTGRAGVRGGCPLCFGGDGAAGPRRHCCCGLTRWR